MTEELNRCFVENVAICSSLFLLKLDAWLYNKQQSMITGFIALVKE